MKIQTPAKINPLLNILGKREDGFHELYMQMVPVSLFDTLTLNNNGGQGLNFRMSGADFSVPPEDNLVVRAVRSFEQESGKAVDLDLFLEKNSFWCRTWRRERECGWNSSGFKSNNSIVSGNTS